MIYLASVSFVIAVIGLSVARLAQKFDHVSGDVSGQMSLTPIPPTATSILIVNAVAMTPTVTASATLNSTMTQVAIHETSIPTATFTFSPPTRLPDTATPSPTRTSTASYTPTLTLTPSLTSTPSLTPSFTLTPTFTFTPSITPTSPYTAIPFANGRRVEVYFDENSFYIWNPNSTSIRLAPLFLQGLDANNQPTGKTFSGEIWAQFYHELEGGKCVAIEITQSSSWLRPSVCRDYNAIVTPQRTSRSVFWLSDGRTVAFEVLWSEQLVGQCSLSMATCDLFLP
ncbi:MAG: hypothetical protein CUN55_07420 [Phototrophicales bacterium]|nr:MAG: hypothetical protein CUN55_07420 [Phototrophicales bacterium]